MAFCGECGAEKGCKHHPNDKCQFCFGTKGGVRGNENVFKALDVGNKEYDVIVCDYCTSLLMDLLKKERLIMIK
jgi:hypothetical protein